MSRISHVWVVLAVLLAAPVASAEEALVPEGESPDILQGVTWSPLVDVHAIAASPDGRLLVSASRDGVLRLWDAISGREARRFPALPGGHDSVAFSGDGKIIAAGGHDGSIHVWDTSGSDIAHIAGDGTPVAALALGEDGHLVLFAPARRTVMVWRTAEKSGPVPYPDSTSETRVIQLSPDGKTFAIGLASRAVQLVEADSLKVVRTISGLGAPPTAIGFSADGATLAIGTESGAVHLVSTTDGQIAKTLDAHSQAVTGVRFAVDGVLVTTAGDSVMRWWNASTGEELRRVVVDGNCCNGLASVEAGRTLVMVSPYALLRRDVVSGTPLRNLVGPASPAVTVAMDMEGKSLLAGALDGTLRLFDVSSGQARQTWQLPESASAVALSLDGRVVAAGVDRAIILYDSDSGRETKRLEGHEGLVLGVAMSGDGARLASASDDRSVRLWETKTGKLVTQFVVPAPATQVAFSKDGLAIAAITDGSVRLFSTEHGKETHRLSVDGTPTGIAFSKDGKRLGVSTPAGLRIFDVGSGTLSKSAAERDMTGVALTSDGKQAVTSSSDGTMRLWNDGTEAAKLEGLDTGATCVTLSGNDAIAAVGTAEGAIHVWKLATKAETVVFRQASAGWVSRQKDKVLRGDGGRWVVRADTTGALTAVTPKGAGAKADVAFDTGNLQPPSDGGRIGRITLKVSNNSATVRAFWVQLVAGDSLPPGLTITPSAVIDRLDPGATADLTVGVAWVTRNGTPAPRDEKIPLKLIQLGGDTAVTPPIGLHIGSAKIDVEVTAIEGGRKLPFIRVQVTNSGDVGTGPLMLTPTFVKDGRVVFSAPTIQLKDLTPQETTLLGIAATKDAATGKASFQLTATGTLWPTERWVTSIPLSKAIPWLWIALGVGLTILLIGAGYLYRVLRHPVVLQVTRDPTELLRYRVRQLPEVDQALRRAGRLNGALVAAKITDTRWHRAVSAGGTPADAATAFAETIGGKRVEQPIAPNLSAWSLELPSLAVRFPKRTALVVCSGAQLDSGVAVNLASAIHANGEGPTAAIALDFTDEQNARTFLHAVPRMSFVVLSANEARDLMLSTEPLVLLQKIISAQRPLSELSPYQTSSGLEEEGLFFGRDRELRAIADRVLHNFIIVAPRQMGKSSLLKAVHRRLSARTDVEVHLITLFEDDLLTRVGRALNRPKPENADQFMDIAGGSRRKPRVWLIDEADSFIVKDARNRYPLAQAMRTLSEEGRGYFVLAGFWHLYAAAFLNPNNPLRNFGEMLRLEPLDRESARALATKPMDALGVSYENAMMVERLLDQTACRAHLITAVCKGMIEQLGPEDRLITEDALEAGLFRNPAVADEFKYWRREPLGRALVRAALIGGPPSRGELRERLAFYGLEAPTEIYSATLDRMELSFLLVPNEQSKLVCPVPLLRRFIEQEEELESGVQRDIHDFLALQRAERSTGTG